jgi:hypothetical protein
VPETTPETGKCTPGRPFWPSRDPIEEIADILTYFPINRNEYEVNELQQQSIMAMYIYVDNTPTTNYDILGLIDACHCFSISFTVGFWDMSGAHQDVPWNGTIKPDWSLSYHVRIKEDLSDADKKCCKDKTAMVEMLYTRRFYSHERRVRKFKAFNVEPRRFAVVTGGGIRSETLGSGVVSTTFQKGTRIKVRLYAGDNKSNVKACDGKSLDATVKSKWWYW